MQSTTTLTEKPAGMSDAQYVYAMALAHYRTVDAEMTRRTAGLSAPDDNPYLDGTPANQAYNDLHYAEAFNLLKQAEDAMIDWADHQMRKSLGKQRYRQIQPVFEKEKVVNLGMKEKLVKICFEFRAPGKIA